MKIICDNCRTKYSIADEKVQGKVFKIRCKKCQNIIVVRGNQSGEDGQSGDEEAGRATVTSSDGAPIWHVVVGREQVGPMTGGEVRERYSRGEIDSESYIWREGFSDWQRLTSVPDFSDLGQATTLASGAQQPGAGGWSGDTAAPAAAVAPASAPAAWNAAPSGSWDAGGTGENWGGTSEDTARADAANLFGGREPEPGRDLFASQQSQDPMVGGGFAASSSASAGGGLFTASSAPSDAGGDMFASSSPPAAAPGGAQQGLADDRGGGGGGIAMTGQRHENSVLFSLSNLQALAMGGKAPQSPTVATGSGGDGSGLIDIRSMALPSAPASASAAADDLPDLGGFAPPIAAAPVLMPLPIADERPKWILPTVIGLGGAVVVTMIVLVLVLVFRKPPAPPPVVVAQPAAPAAVPTPTPTTAAAVASAAATNKTGTPAAAENSAEAKEETKVAENKAAVEAKGGKRGKGSKGGKAGKVGKGTKVAAAPAVDSSPAAEEPKAKASGRSKKKGDDLDALIDGAMSGGGSKKAGKKTAAAGAAAGGGGGGGGGGSNLPDAPSRAEIQGGMRKIKDRVQGCYDKFRVPGTAFVSVTIAPSGTVSAAKVKGIFAGTPTGACLQSAARIATFPRFKGPAFTIDYPFILR